MNTLERIEEKGIKRGIEIGEKKSRDEVIKNLIRISDLKDDQIALAAGVTADYVSSMRNALER
ncbi:hypothetical protein DYBT9275_02966 [Dyadobacter sp. CECT 9275]|uniref:Uncharacterized protein n=1 Tax=Dyadobacter helix TaxID=2822344 RepID=A0A916JCK7_9BACT|nr:hypothetical protein [Dyadobacter sp. CECT 9275]CAG5002794.1 hypothetical protein DYBT9275_02966 [Dyadobacter sp. CECT 9275]